MLRVLSNDETGYEKINDNYFFFLIRRVIKHMFHNVKHVKFNLLLSPFQNIIFFSYKLNIQLFRFCC